MRLRCAGTGVHTRRWPLAQQCLTPHCLRVQRGQGISTLSQMGRLPSRCIRVYLTNSTDHAPGSTALLQQGSQRPPKGSLHTTTHTTARAAGQPTHPGGGGHASTQAICGSDPPQERACTQQAHPPHGPRQRGERDQATQRGPSGTTRQATAPGAPSGTARPRGHRSYINTPPREALA